ASSTPSRWSPPEPAAVARAAPPRAGAAVSWRVMVLRRATVQERSMAALRARCGVARRRRPTMDEEPGALDAADARDAGRGQSSARLRRSSSRSEALTLTYWLSR